MKKLVPVAILLLVSAALSAQALTPDVITRFENTLTSFNSLDAEFFNTYMEENFSETYDLKGALDSMAQAIGANAPMNQIIQGQGFTPTQWAHTAKRVIGSILVIIMEDPEFQAQLDMIREMIAESEGEESEEFAQQLSLITDMIDEFSVPADIEAVRPYMESLAEALDMDLPQSGDDEYNEEDYPPEDYNYEDYDYEEDE